MEGKALLFKRLADIDAFDIELDVVDPKELVRIAAAMAPTFGGINLEDIKAPECFEVEDALRTLLPIPVFHDDQHGTAIVVGAALLNGIEIQGKTPGNVRVVIAGAAGIACAAMLCALGLATEQVVLVDSRGVVHAERTDQNRYKQLFATRSEAWTLSDALRGADVFIVVSGPGTVTAEMLRSMAERPLIFAPANPEPEVRFDVVQQARGDAVFASGRSDDPNQVNNVLAFSSIFRGELDVRATRIDEEMKLAACRAIAALAPESKAFGPAHIIPLPLDSGVLPRVAAAVAGAVARSGAASRPLEDLDAYSEAVTERVRRAQIARGLDAAPDEGADLQR
jgi:malate dehydrogenase (oxaloacetate-decarboxylating)(NADP+)